MMATQWRPNRGRPEVQRAIEADEEGYECYECGKHISGLPYARIHGGLSAYDGESGLRLSLKWLCVPCWRIECLGAGIQW